MNLRARNLISLCAMSAPLAAAIAGCDRTVSVPRVGAAPAVTSTAARPTVEPAIALVRSEDGATHKDAVVRPAAHLSSVAESTSHSASPTAPDWAADAVFYQIFPERFANGDPSNDPTIDSLESPERVPDTWKISPWTGDWYARSDWEKKLGPNFYENGVFDRRFGGDLQGVINRLDYLSELGINVIYFNPLFYARSLHKYDGASFHHIDPNFGPDPHGDLALIAEETEDPATWHWTAADKLFLDLVRQAHARGIRVIIDGVFNHTGRDFFAFADLRRNQAASRYKDWYIVQAFDDPATPQNEFRYRGWWGVDTLPELARNAEGNNLYDGPKQYIFEITKRWMDPNGDGDPSDGIDGWRLDVANEVPTGFWHDWHQLVRGINPQAYTVAEMWGDAKKFLEDGGFSATMNYYAFSFPVKGFLIDDVLPPSEAQLQLTARRTAYPEATQFVLQNLVDSHDTDRVASMIVNAGHRPYKQPERFDYDINVSPRYIADYDVRKPNEHERRIQRLVALMQMTYVGPPMIYYGTEAGMWGADDPCDRQPMVWPDMTYEPQQSDPLGRARQADAVEFDPLLYSYYRAAISLRRENAALRHGSIEFVKADNKANFLAFRRSDQSDAFFVGFNRGEADYQWEIPLAAGEELDQVFTASGNLSAFAIDRQSDKAIVTVPACDGVVLKLRHEK
jgi:cyclomaltodextrinase / maltogenic alpha-amylase / neopullulanase